VSQSRFFQLHTWWHQRRSCIVGLSEEPSGSIQRCPSGCGLGAGRADNLRLEQRTGPAPQSSTVTGLKGTAAATVTRLNSNLSLNCNFETVNCDSSHEWLVWTHPSRGSTRMWFTAGIGWRASAPGLKPLRLLFRTGSITTFLFSVLLVGLRQW